jgi:hypothetical protein
MAFPIYLALLSRTQSAKNYLSAAAQLIGQGIASGGVPVNFESGGITDE